MVSYEPPPPIVNTCIDPMMWPRQNVTATTGWLCPACGRGNAPTTATCPCVAPHEIRISVEAVKRMAAARRAKKEQGEPS